MKPFAILAVAAALVFAAGPGRAQNVILKAGQPVVTQGVRREGANLIVKVNVGGNLGEVGYAVADVARIEFPEPQGRKLAADALAQGRADEALKQINAALPFYAPFRDIPGSWWTQLALLQVDAYSRLGRDNEADAVANELAKIGGATPDVLRTVKIRQASSAAKKGDAQGAINLLTPIVTDPDVPASALPEAWLTLGGAHLSKRNYKPALLAYLHIPVYTPEPAVMPAAMLGCAQAYTGLGESARAIDTLQKLVTDYPNARETPDAKARLQKLKVGAAPAK